MSGKLDQSLDEIVSTQRRTGGRRGGRGGRQAGRPATTAPIGGVQKTRQQSRAGAAKQAPTRGPVGKGDSKAVVSNLPRDVNENQIKEYFVTSVGPVKRVEIAYGPNSVSRGIATVTFVKPDGAQRAFTALNGLLVDGRPIKIEIVVSANQAAEIMPPAKSLAERTSQPKAQPKSAAVNKKKEGTAKDAAAGGARGRGKKTRSKSSRPTKKTAEELDSEMADYFVAGNPSDNVNGEAPAAANGNGDAAMEDEIM